MAKYICKNFGACGKADAKEEIDVLPGTEAKCPECRSSLHEVGKAAAGMETAGLPKWILPAAVAGLALIGGGGWYAYSTYLKKPAEVVVTAVDVARTALDIARSSLPAQTSGDVLPTGPRPDETALQALKEESEGKLIQGDATGAETASRRAAAMEMVKTSISYLAQGNLDRAEKELNAALERAPDEPLVSYNLAVLRIKQQRIDDAFALLETALAKGLKEFGAMERDPDLAPMRKDARYQTLLAKYRQGG